MVYFRIDEDSLLFKGIGVPDKKAYEVKINFYKKINPDKVLSKNSGRCYEFVITKADTTSEYWPALTTDKKKPHWLKVDFNKWKDEGSDDENENGAGGDMGGMGNFNDLMGSMGGMGGMGGMPGMGDLGMGLGGDKPSFDDLDEEEDSDDEEIPDLEEAKK